MVERIKHFRLRLHLIIFQYYSIISHIGITHIKVPVLVSRLRHQGALIQSCFSSIKFLLLILRSNINKVILLKHMYKIHKSLIIGSNFEKIHSYTFTVTKQGTSSPFLFFYFLVFLTNFHEINRKSSVSINL